MGPFLAECKVGLHLSLFCSQSFPVVEQAMQFRKCYSPLTRRPTVKFGYPFNRTHVGGGFLYIYNKYVRREYTFSMLVDDALQASLEDK
jgi:hypothetical protein